MGNIIQNLQENTDTENEYYVSDDQDDDNDYFELYAQDDTNRNSNCTYTVNTILNGTARLKVLFPSTTILVFTIFAQLITNNGKCTTLDRWLTGGFVALLATFCVFFSITDSFRTATGRLYYGVATFHGIRTFGGGQPCRPDAPSDYRVGWGDVFRALLSVIVFLVFASMRDDVITCYRAVLPRKFIDMAPLMVGFVVCLLFVLFPSARRGVGYPFLLHSDGLHVRY